MQVLCSGEQTSTVTSHTSGTTMSAGERDKKSYRDDSSRDKAWYGVWCLLSGKSDRKLILCSKT